MSNAVDGLGVSIKVGDMVEVLDFTQIPAMMGHNPEMNQYIGQQLIIDNLYNVNLVGRSMACASPNEIA